MEKFKTGDVVVLKSGGPKMTVSAYNGDWAQCYWFPTEFSKVETSSFNDEMLELYQDDKAVE